MDGYTYKAQQGGSAIDLDDLGAFLKLALPNYRRREEFEAMLPAFKKPHCVTLEGAPAGRSPRVMLRVGDVQRYISIRTILAFMATGKADIGMPASTCAKGCIHPHHAVSTTPTDLGKFLSRLVIHTNPKTH